VLADPTLLAVPASAPWKTLQDFVDDAKKRPGEIAYGSSGPYGTLHVAMEMFAASAGIKLLHVPFRGAGPALTALLSGTVMALASAPGTLKQQVADGKMRVLANWADSTGRRNTGFILFEGIGRVVQPASSTQAFCAASYSAHGRRHLAPWLCAG
jgi:hypothetical protein